MAQQINVTVPGMKLEPIFVPDTCTIAELCRRIYDKTGVRLFNGFGFTSQGAGGANTATYTVQTEAAVTTQTIFDTVTGTNVAASNFLIPPPAAPATATATTGGSVAAGTYNVRVTYLNAAGETLSSANSTQVTTGATSTITVTSPVASADATQYKVYMGTGTPTLQGGATNIGTNFVQTAAVTGGAALPVANTASSPTTYTTLLSTLGINHGDELIVFNVPVGG